ncbi:MAG: zonular occludens toxin domain-containing protein [Gallionella sp.]|nr:zonular occludens toxin domain-containing protein [Gallionella sp.]
MSIIFLEGVPGSGKSYEAVVTHLLPRLKIGRKCITNIRGINVEMFAEILARPVEWVRENLIIVPWEETKNVSQNIIHDALYLLDEVQDFWPSVRDKLDEKMTEFITQHRQFGLDIVLMGQCLKDVHNTWRGRVEKKYYFQKLDVLGLSTRYQWSCYQRKGEKFVFINDGGGKYDKKFFGLYQSYRPESENRDTYGDKRTTIWTRKSIRYGVPLVVIVSIYALYFLWSIFSGHRSITGTGITAANASEIKAPARPEPYSVNPSLPASAVVLSVPQTVAVQPTIQQLDQLSQLVKDFRPRVGYMLKSETRLMGSIEFYDSSMHRHEVLTFEQIGKLGGSIELGKDDLLLKYKTGSLLVTAWPLFDQMGQISEAAQRSPQITGRKD